MSLLAAVLSGQFSDLAKWKKFHMFFWPATNFWTFLFEQAGYPNGSILLDLIIYLGRLMVS